MVVRVSVADAEAGVELMQRILREVDVRDVNLARGQRQVRIFVPHHHSAM